MDLDTKMAEKMSKADAVHERQAARCDKKGRCVEAVQRHECLWLKSNLDYRSVSKQ